MDTVGERLGFVILHKKNNKAGVKKTKKIDLNCRLILFFPKKANARNKIQKRIIEIKNNP